MTALDQTLRAMAADIPVPEGACDRAWSKIRQFLDAEPGMATSNPGNAGAGSRTPFTCLTAQPPLPGGRLPAGEEVGEG